MVTEAIRVIDFETTGTDPDLGAQVCEVGTSSLELDVLLVSPPKSWLCRVEAMPPEVRAVHHITLEECQAPGVLPFHLDDVLEGNHRCLAAHNAEFEALFLGELPVPLVCTYKAALRVWPDAPGHSNGVLRYWLEDRGQLELDRARAEPVHRAGPDAYVTAHILRALIREGVTVEQLIEWTAEPRLLPTCPIGKFRGKPWDAVDWGFLDWMLRKGDMDEDLKWNARREMDRRRDESAARTGRPL